MPPSPPAETLRSAIALCIPQRAPVAAMEITIPDNIITSLQKKTVNDRKEAYTWLADNLSPVDPQHNHALLTRLALCEDFLVDAVLQVKQCIMTTMLGLLEGDAWLEATAYDIILPRIIRAYLSDVKCGSTVTRILHTVAMKKGLDGPLAVLALVMVELDRPSLSWCRLFIERGVDALVSLMVNFSPCALKYPERVLGPILLWCREDLLGCPQLQRVGEKLARCLCGYGGESMRAHLNYSGTYEPAIPPIVRIDGFNEDLPGGGIRFDIPVVVADGLKSNASQTVSREARRSPVERRRSRPLSTDQQPPPVPVSKRPIGDVLGSPSYKVAEHLLSRQWSVRMEALASLKSALVNEHVCGRSITEEIGASLSNLIEKETHRKCLSKTLGVVCLAAKADPHCKSVAQVE
ncbi:hypothetical protein FOZ60_017022 [Perkinsus olseni]|uniref:Uncharacterized protein n=1 Tax=Perkinsus olseni TaxID=32597 RepID=A0A7J6N2T4_PEROL|nr:hypothetical protein FOZ60_017022 [Perkinsus olseni]